MMSVCATELPRAPAHFTQSQDDLAGTFQALGIAGHLRRVTGGETTRLG